MTATTTLPALNKRVIALRYWLLGRDYSTAVRALDMIATTPVQIAAHLGVSPESLEDEASAIPAVGTLIGSLPLPDHEKTAVAAEISGCLYGDDTLVLDESCPSYIKQFIALRFWLLGREFRTAVRALEFGARYHDGKRDDGNPEYSHQVAMAHFGRTLPIPHHAMETLLILLCLHDLCEDYPEEVSFEDLDAIFGRRIGALARLFSKVHGGVKMDNVAYYAGLLSDPLTALGKGIDRVHNIGSMVGGFSIERQKKYIEETEKLVLDLIKKARRAYPEFEAALENIKHSLEAHLKLIKAIHAAAENAAA